MSQTKPKFKEGDRVYACGFPGVVKVIHVRQFIPWNILYDVEIFGFIHQVWESDMRKVEAVEPVRGEMPDIRE